MTTHLHRSPWVSRSAAALLGSLLLLPLPTRADEPTAPFKLSMEPTDPSVYALPTPTKENEGINQGGVNIDLTVTYLSDYLYRGVDRAEFLESAAPRQQANERADFQLNGKLSWDLGKLPHPFVGVFMNVVDNDPIQTFQEVRPVFGFDWYLRPFLFTAGNNTYIFPDRGNLRNQKLNTGEAFVQITLDDAALLRRDEPLLSPYIYGAYDYDVYNGWYFEAGVSHDFVIEGTGITLTAQASVAYVEDHQAFALAPDGRDTGFQHYQVGLIGKYSLNQLLNLPQRYGHWSLNGYIFYADGIDNEIRADTELWGGAGIQFTY